MHKFNCLQKNLQSHLALLGTNLFFAINLTAVKYLISNGYVKAFGLNFIRISVTAALLWLIFLFKPTKTRIDRKDFGRFVFCSITGIVINQLLFIKGLSFTYPIHASLLMLITPILITLIASWILKEKINSYKIIGLVFGISGAAVLILSRVQAANAKEVMLGDILIIINAISYTFYFILVKPLMKAYNPITVIRMIFTIGVFIAFPFCWSEFLQTPWHLYGGIQWTMLGLIVIGGTFLAYLFNVYGIKNLGASVAGSYIYSQPVFAAIIAVLFLGDVLELYKIIAAVFIFSGVYLANKNIAND